MAFYILILILKENINVSKQLRPDQTLHFASDLCLRCLTMFHKKTLCLYGLPNTAKFTDHRLPYDSVSDLFRYDIMTPQFLLKFRDFMFKYVLKWLSIGSKEYTKSTDIVKFASFLSQTI